MDIENTASFPEESLDEIFELDIRVSSISDEENLLLLTYVVCTYIDCAEGTTIRRGCGG